MPALDVYMLDCKHIQTCEIAPRSRCIMPTQTVWLTLLLHIGMYLDLDNECTTPSETIFHDYDAVLQGSGWEGVNNGMMASAPGHPMWMKYAPCLSYSIPLYHLALMRAKHCSLSAHFLLLCTLSHFPSLSLIYA